MFDLFKRSIRTRSGKVFCGGIGDFAESEHYVDHIHWIFPWKRERIYLTDIESDCCDLDGGLLMRGIILTVIIFGLIGFIIVEADGWPFNNMQVAQQIAGPSQQPIVLETRPAVSICEKPADVQQGSEGIMVARLQFWLGEHYQPYPDGIFGDETKQAVMAYQAAHNLSATGAVDQATWAALSNNCRLL